MRKRNHEDCEGGLTGARPRCRGAHDVADRERRLLGPDLTGCVSQPSRASIAIAAPVRASSASRYGPRREADSRTLYSPRRRSARAPRICAKAKVDLTPRRSRRRRWQACSPGASMRRRTTPQVREPHVLGEARPSTRPRTRAAPRRSSPLARDSTAMMSVKRPAPHRLSGKELRPSRRRACSPRCRIAWRAPAAAAPLRFLPERLGDVLAGEHHSGDAAFGREERREVDAYEVTCRARGEEEVTGTPNRDRGRTGSCRGRAYWSRSRNAKTEAEAHRACAAMACGRRQSALACSLYRGSALRIAEGTPDSST